MIRAFIVAASPSVRASLEHVLVSQGVAVAGAVSNIELLGDHLVQAGADVVLIDASTEQFEAVLRSIDESELALETAVVLLADHPSPGSFAKAVRVGIGAILPTGTFPVQLVAAMQATAAGLIVIHRDEMDSTFPATTPASRPLAELAEPLSPREREVLQMLASGLGNKEIAARLTISEHTVKFHVASILGKLGAATRTEAVTLGIRHGLVLL